MKTFSKCIASCALFLILVTAAFGLPFSNAIFFGDSLTDIGNLPEDAKPFVDPSKPKEDIENQTPNFYVPISSPINPNTQAESVPLTKVFHLNRLPYDYQQFMHFNEPFFADQPKIQGESRLYRSMIWPEFFLADAYQDGYTLSQTLIPWTYIQTHDYPASINTSIDYAWASALSGTHCYSPLEWTDRGSCDGQAVIAAWLQYQQDPSSKHLIDIIKIPALLAQEQIFIQDIQNKKVQVGPDTLYTLWIGGNDLAMNFDIIERNIKDYKDPAVLIKLLQALGNILANIAFNNYEGMSTLAKNQAIQAQHIYLFNTFNPLLSPRFYHWSPPLQLIGSAFVSLYDEELEKTVEWMHQDYSNVEVHLVDTHSWLNDMARGKGPYASLAFSEHVGTACESDHFDDVTQPMRDMTNCSGYLFWNSIHPAMPTEQIFGYLLSQEVAHTFNHPSAYTLLKQPVSAEARKKELEKMAANTVAKLINELNLAQ